MRERLRGPRRHEARAAAGDGAEAHVEAVEAPAVDEDDAEGRRRVRRGRRDLARVERLGSTRVIQRRFNVSVPRARVPTKASTLRGRSER